MEDFGWSGDEFLLGDCMEDWLQRPEEFPEQDDDVLWDDVVEPEDIDLSSLLSDEDAAMFMDID